MSWIIIIIIANYRIFYLNTYQYPTMYMPILNGKKPDKLVSRFEGFPRFKRNSYFYREQPAKPRTQQLTNRTQILPVFDLILKYNITHIHIHTRNIPNTHLEYEKNAMSSFSFIGQQPSHRPLGVIVAEYGFLPERENSSFTQIGLYTPCISISRTHPKIT